mmetsp:Transcript_9124/g.13683  ORF Transcript_9124/g.13683 Transcript_9124/m.13683 type:complete len:734 (+) Transcript_9124:138-2339(+)
MPIKASEMSAEDYLKSSWSYDAFEAPSQQNNKNFQTIKNSRSLNSFRNLEKYSKNKEIYSPNNEIYSTNKEIYSLGSEIYSANKEAYSQGQEIYPESYDFVDLDEQQDTISCFQEISPTQTHPYLLKENMGMGMRASSTNNLSGKLSVLSNGSSIFPTKNKSSLGLRSQSVSNFQSKEPSSLFAKSYEDQNSVSWEDQDNHPLRYRANGDRGFSSLYPASTGNLGGLIGSRSDDRSKDNLGMIQSLFRPSNSLTYNRSDTDLVASFDRSLKISEENEIHHSNVEIGQFQHSPPKSSPGPTIRQHFSSMEESVADQIEFQGNRANLIIPNSSSPLNKSNAMSQFSNHQSFPYNHGQKGDFYGNGDNIGSARNKLMNNVNPGIYNSQFNSLNQFERGYCRGRDGFFYESEDLSRYEAFMLEQLQNQQQQMALFQNQQQQMALYQSLLMRGAAQVPFPGMMMPGYMNGMNMLAMPNLAAQAGLNRTGYMYNGLGMDSRDFQRNGGFLRDPYEDRDNRRGMFDIIEDPGDGNIYQVQFKRGVRSFLLSMCCERTLKKGDYVKVEADRGEDLGLIVGIFPIHEGTNNSNKSSMNGYRNKTDISNCQKERILRAANESELAQFRENMIEEKNVLAVCRSKVLQRGLPMEVMDAEYQYDRNKLTFFFKAEGRIDFRELVRDLYALYKTRIWMQQVDPSHITMPIPGEGMNGDKSMGSKIACEGETVVMNSTFEDGSGKSA